MNEAASKLVNFFNKTFVYFCAVRILEFLHVPYYVRRKCIETLHSVHFISVSNQLFEHVVYVSFYFVESPFETDESKRPQSDNRKK